MRIQKADLIIGLTAAGGGLMGYSLANAGDLSSIVSLRSVVTLTVIFIVTVLALAGLRRLGWIGQPGESSAGGAGEAHTPPRSGWGIVAMVTLGFIGFVGVAWAVSDATGVSLRALIDPDPAAFALGVLATLPMLIFLAVIMMAPGEGLRRFKDKQITHFEKMGFSFTMPQIIAISLGAGISEELLFRGALQGWLMEIAPVWVAILAPSLVFGLVHGANLTYMAIAAAIGVYFAVITLMTGNLVVPMTAHALYDVVALWVTARAIEARRTVTAGQG